MNNKLKVKFDGASPVAAIPYIISVCAALMYTICRQHAVLCSIVMSVLAAGIYLLFYILRNKPKLAMLSILLLGTPALLLGGGFSEDSFRNGFHHFLFSASESFNILYAARAIFVFSVVIGFVCCFFSAVSPRPCFLMLLMFIPLMLSARTAGGLGVGFLLPMYGTFALAAANMAHPVTPENTFESRKVRLERLAVSLALSLLVTVIAALLPRSTETALEDYLNGFVISSNGYYANMSQIANFTNSSSINTGNNNTNGTVLFVVWTNSPDRFYLDRQAFENYSSNGWTCLEDFDTGYANWERESRQRSTNALIRALKTAVSNGKLGDYAEMLDAIPMPEDSSYRMRLIKRDTSQARVILHPVGIYDLTITNESMLTYRTPRGEIFTENKLNPSASYDISFYPEGSTALAPEIDRDSFARLLSDALDEGAITQGMYDAFFNELTEANKYRRLTENSGVSPEIKELALEITDGLSTDIEKARAIEKWFGEAGFVYDLDFVPQGSGTEYFLFDSRRGICSDYAAAMTLLARAAGLTARYTEGFLLPPEETVSEYSSGGHYYSVTDAQAHAYASIYIAGAGWLSFDGTRYAIPAEEADSISPLLLIIPAAALILIIIFREKIGWALFALTYRVRKPKSRVKAVYVRMKKTASAISRAPVHSMSSGEAEKIIANALSLPEEAAQIRRAADGLFYSGDSAQPEPDGTIQLYSCIKTIRRTRRRLKK